MEGKRGVASSLAQRIARVEFADGSLVRRNARSVEGERAVVELDVLAISFDARLQTTLSIYECKSGRGQKGEPERLLWLKGVKTLLDADRAVLVREGATPNGRILSRKLGLEILDTFVLSRLEAECEWIPESFAHLSGSRFANAEREIATQLREIKGIPWQLIRFLWEDASTLPGYRALGGLMTLGETAGKYRFLPEPAKTMIAAYALSALVVALTRLGGKLNQYTAEEIRILTLYGLTTGRPDGQHVVRALEAADAYYQHHMSGFRRDIRSDRSDDITIPSVVQEIVREPPWMDRLIDAVERFRARGNIARTLPLTVDLVAFDGLLGDVNWQAPAFDHLFTIEHKQLVLVSLRLLEHIVGPALIEPLKAVETFAFNRVPAAVPDRHTPFDSRSGPRLPLDERVSETSASIVSAAKSDDPPRRSR